MTPLLRRWTRKLLIKSKKQIKDSKIVKQTTDGAKTV